MKFYAVFTIFIVLALASAFSMPEASYDGPTYELKSIDEPEGSTESNTDLPPVRMRRVTCDLFSFESHWLSVNHAACAAKCIAQRRWGGRCRDGACVCR